MMKLLLDTHAFIWWDSDLSRLPSKSRAAIEDPANEVLLSVVCLWEIAIKSSLGKLIVNRPLKEIYQDQIGQGLQRLSFDVEHVFYLETLPEHHKDPFDRALIAQAGVEQAILVGCDAAFAAYRIPLLWS
jgi:PIN domain nuclease of toxin-antitoxin system